MMMNMKMDMIIDDDEEEDDDDDDDQWRFVSKDLDMQFRNVVSV